MTPKVGPNRRSDCRTWRQGRGRPEKKGENQYRRITMQQNRKGEVLRNSVSEDMWGGCGWKVGGGGKLGGGGGEEVLGHECGGGAEMGGGGERFGGEVREPGGSVGGAGRGRRNELGKGYGGWESAHTEKTGDQEPKAVAFWYRVSKKISKKKNGDETERAPQPGCVERGSPWVPSQFLQTN